MDAYLSPAFPTGNDADSDTHGTDENEGHSDTRGTDENEGYSDTRGTDENDGLEPIEIVDELFFEDVVDEPPSPPPIAPANRDPYAVFVAAIEASAMANGATPSDVALLRGLFGTHRLDPVSIPDPVAGELVQGGIASRSAAALSGGWSRSDRFTRQVLAWQNILRGESEDYAACGPLTLDEWAADAMARALGATARSPLFRIDLRHRGIAAFGLIAA